MAREPPGPGEVRVRRGSGREPSHVRPRTGTPSGGGSQSGGTLRCPSRRRARPLQRAKGLAHGHGLQHRGRCPREIAHFSNPDILYDGVPTGDLELRNNARVINNRAEVAANYRRRGAPIPPPKVHTHHLPLVPEAQTGGIQGFVRIRNRTNRYGEVAIHAIDDTGTRFGPVTFELAAGATGNFNSDDLERGNPARGLVDGLGDGTGTGALSWRQRSTSRQGPISGPQTGLSPA